jgi:DNA-binding response OmpR family regulator
MTGSLGRVLVVDDDPNIGVMLRDLLIELGYVVKNAVRGAEALQLVRVFEPDVVLLDLLMPEMSGAELLDLLRRDHPTVPVIIVTGNDDVEVARRTLRSGAFDYVCKPFTVDVLARIVAVAIAIPR